MRKLISNFIILLLVSSGTLYAQEVEQFLTPSDSLNVGRRTGIIISESVLAGAAIVGLNQLWYSDYEKSDFHYINDNAEWLQMDKVGHVYSSYQLSNLGYNLLNWSGISEKNKLIYGAGAGLVFLSAVEVLDGYSSQWGASLGDVAANVGGTTLFVSQQLLWKEQRIIPKFSFHTTPYSNARPDVLGDGLPEEILKDYNGQTYWLSANIHSFWKNDLVPEWLNLAAGYGAEGMLTGKDRLVNTVFLPDSARYRQYYLSLDVDLSKIKTNSHLLKTVFAVFNTIKVPAPTLEINGKGTTKFHLLYF